MRILLNGLAALKPKTGVGQYVAHLQTGLEKLLPSGAVSVFPGGTMSRWLSRSQTKPIAESVKTTPPLWKRRVSAAGKEAARLAARAQFAAYTRAFSFDVYHEPNFLPFPCHRPTVVTVHDLSVWHHPEWHPADRVRQHRLHFEKGIRNAAHVIVVSDEVRREVLAEFGLPKQKVTRVYQGISSQFRPYTQEELAPFQERLRLPQSFLLAVGTVEPRKNLLAVLKAYVDLPLALRSKCPLVLAGPWGWRSADVREYFEKVAQPAGVMHMGYVADADLPAVYAGATALVFPTRYEGFGLPPVEMLASGGQVLVSDLPITREILGPFATYIPWDDLAGWREAMSEAITSECRNNSSAIRHAKSFTWGNTATETLAVYNSVLAPASRLAA